MTTKIWEFPLQHNNNETFRAWGSDLSAALAEVGLIKTADTGQINWTTAVYASIGSLSAPYFAGYEIWRYPDSSIFMKWEFGTVQPNSPSTPGIRITVGRGSDGAGTLTGVNSASRQMMFGVSGGPSLGPTTLWRSYLVLKDGFFGFWGYRSTTSTHSRAFFAVARTVDANGVTSGLGATVYWKNDNTNDYPAVQALNFETFYYGSVRTVGDFCLVPHGIASCVFYSGENLDANTQIFVHWTALPKVFPVMPLCSVLSNEVPTASTFDVALVGTTQRKYMAIDTVIYGATDGGTSVKMAMLWE